MKITICGSIKFFNEIKDLKNKLELLDYNIFSPAEDGTEIDYQKLTFEEQINIKSKFIDEHLDKIKKSDAILVANYDKNGVRNYIGANTFLEMAFAYVLNKPIFLLNDIPSQDNGVEIRGMKPVVLRGNLNKINSQISNY